VSLRQSETKQRRSLIHVKRIMEVNPMMATEEFHVSVSIPLDLRIRRILLPGDALLAWLLP
jgi:hypothetical protein